MTSDFASSSEFESWLYDHPSAAPDNPVSTAVRGARRMRQEVRDLIPASMRREDAMALASNADGPEELAKVFGGVSFVFNTTGAPVVVEPGENFAPPVQLLPVRRLGSYRGARSRICGHPHLTDAGPLLLLTESVEELGWIQWMEFNPQIHAMRTQPLAMVWNGPHGSLYRVPDVLVRDDDGWVLVDVRPTALRNDFFNVMSRLTAAAAERVGVRYAVAPDLSDMALRNLMEVAARRWFRPDLFDALVEVRKARPRTIGGILDVAGWNWVGATCALHLLAHEVSTDLYRRLDETSPLRWPHRPQTETVQSETHVVGQSDSNQAERRRGHNVEVGLVDHDVTYGLSSQPGAPEQVDSAGGSAGGSWMSHWATWLPDDAASQRLHGVEGRETT